MTSQESSPNTEPQLTEAEKQILDLLGTKAQPHIIQNQKEGGNMVLLDPHPSQLSHHIAGTPIPPYQIEKTATDADPSYPALKQATERAMERSPHTFMIVRELLRSGCNVALVTPHGKLHDIAFLFTSMCDLLAQNPDFSEIVTNYRRGVMVSKIISRIGIKFEGLEEPLPAEKALGFTAHDVWESYPNTDSIAGIRQRWQSITQKNNNAVRDGIKDRYKKGGYLLALAPSGRQDTLSEEVPGTYVLHRIKYGTAKILTEQKTFVLAAAVSLLDNAPIVDFIETEPGNPASKGVPRALRNIGEVHQLWEAMAVNLGRLVGDKNFIYQPEEPEEDKTGLRRIVDHMRPRS